MDLESPHTYPTVDGYVYETRVDFSNWTQWDSFWMYGSNWPVAGEIDATEGGDGINAISYHYEGADGPASMSSCNDRNNCDSSATRLPLSRITRKFLSGGTLSMSPSGHAAPVVVLSTSGTTASFTAPYQASMYSPAALRTIRTGLPTHLDRAIPPITETCVIHLMAGKPEAPSP